ncbi:NAD(P)-binding protein [Lepidopterella palustris CBS 459.81]|uniref:NAD(P)-binding protein n=1 Tax=Lepidopterella palustris CBS 459.81 TaxID=1314670 RepID=A0A8E2ELC0_9PEZI|nr:NAD(P)-binding protein [Lepidopterella palustris CBS 459.81]
MITSTPVVLITGANQGLGLSIAKLLSQSPNPYHIIIGSRSLPRGQAAVAELSNNTTTTKSTLSAIQLDITSLPSITSAVSQITSTHSRLDILINNAGIGASGGGNLASDIHDFKVVFDTNVLGTVSVTDAFVPLLRKSQDPKIVVMSSTMGSITMAETMPAHTWNASAYRASKAALNMLIVEWNKLLGKEEREIRVWGVDPGLCATSFIGDYSKSNGRDPAEGAAIVLGVIEGKRDDDVGKVCYDQWGEVGVRPW